VTRNQDKTRHSTFNYALIFINSDLSPLNYEIIEIIFFIKL